MKGALQLTGLADSGNTSALYRLMSSKFPLIIVLTELAAQMQAKDFDLDLQWTPPRNQNEEADGLTKNMFKEFDPALRIEVQVDKLPFIVMERMLGVADHLY